MRRIIKTNAPPELLKWMADNGSFNHNYAALAGTDVHAVLKTKLLSEQGYLCAYTGRAIEKSSSHIEHVKPQSVCADWEDVEYRNVVACFPADGGGSDHGYGAPVKGGWWVESEFVSPLSNDCERRFVFSWTGQISPSPNDHVAARTTIERLGLDNDCLTQLRHARIRGFFGLGARTRGRPLSVADAETAFRNIDGVDGKGRLPEFCFMLKQLLPRYIAGGGR